MPVTKHLNNNPDLRAVAQARSDFEAAHGPADLFYDGALYDPWEDVACDLEAPLVVERLHPRLDQMVVPLLDGFFPWAVRPIAPYRFELVAREPGAAPAVSQINEAALWPEWTAALLPYAEASKLTDLGAILRRLDFAEPIDAPSSAGSIAATFRARAKRCGVYVLHFANGQIYVGQTVDITRRFQEHRRSHGDIAQLSFRPLGRRDLDTHEAQLIWLLEHRGFRLRNIDMTSILATEPGAFDELMDAERQRRWLSDMAYSDLGGERVEVTRSDEAYQQRFARLKASGHYKQIFPVVQAYVRNALPAARSGEASYWQASVLPPSYTVLVRINVNWQEVFFTNIGDRGLLFYFVLSRRELQRSFGDDLAGLGLAYPDAEWEEAWYRAGGGDQLSLTIWGAQPALRFVTDPMVLPAIRHYNLRLMKKGKCPWARKHTFDLVTEMLGAQPAAAPVGVENQ